jgi:hypothetical protein
VSKQLVVFAPPVDASASERREFCKSVADVLRVRAGLAPTDADGNAPRKENR